MDKLIDNVARILGSPMPRRRALALLARSLVAGVVVGGTASRLGAQSAPPCGTTTYNGTTTTASNCNANVGCPTIGACPTNCCIQTISKNCSNQGGSNRRCDLTVTCAPIAAGAACSVTTQSTCCAPPAVTGGSACCNGTCCGAGTTCSNNVCCAAGSVGCGGTCCPSPRVCCGVTCCSQGFCCVGGMCTPSNGAPCP